MPRLISTSCDGPAGSGGAPPRRRGLRVAAFAAVALAVGGGLGFGEGGGGREPIKHVVVVVEENHPFVDIIGNTREAPYLNYLADTGASFTDAHAIEHPSQPNYLDLFSGGNQGVRGDGCLSRPLDAPNLASELFRADLSFVGYAEGLPAPGSMACFTLFTAYARKHAPWTDFGDLEQARVSQPFGRFPRNAEGFAELPTVSFVIPGVRTDMHSGSIRAADNWLRVHLGPYVTWAEDNASLLVVAWDEDDTHHGNRVPLIVVGAGVRPGVYGRRVDHFSVLRFIEELYGLPLLGASASAPPIGDIWRGAK